MLLQRSLSNTEEECAHLREMCEVSQKELNELAEKHQDQLHEVKTLEQKLEVGSKFKKFQSIKANFRQFIMAFVCFFVSGS